MPYAEFLAQVKLSLGNFAYNEQDLTEYVNFCWWQCQGANPKKVAQMFRECIFTRFSMERRVFMYLDKRLL